VPNSIITSVLRFPLHLDGIELEQQTIFSGSEQFLITRRLPTVSQNDSSEVLQTPITCNVHVQQQLVVHVPFAAEVAVNGIKMNALSSTKLNQQMTAPPLSPIQFQRSGTGAPSASIRRSMVAAIGPKDYVHVDGFIGETPVEVNALDAFTSESLTISPRPPSRLKSSTGDFSPRRAVATKGSSPSPRSERFIALTSDGRR
jgi:hypothetical protein